MKRFLINPIWLAVLVLAALSAGCGEENGVIAGSSAGAGASFWLPALAPIGDKSVSEGELLSFTVYSSDASGSTLIFFASGLSAGASFNPTTRTFTWTPSYAQNGTYNVKFSVMNSWNLIAEETITITVADVNVTPVIAAMPTKTVSEGSLLNFTVPGSDAGNDTLTYEITGLPSGATFISSTGVFNWTPDYTQSGSYPGITVRATDPGALYDEETFDIIVSNTNRAPTLSAIGNKAIAETSLLTFTISGSDPDGDAITHTASNLPTGATFDSGTRTFSWTPDYSQSGNYTTVKFRVTDTDGLYAEETITIVVNNVNRTPTLTAIGNKSTNENSSLSFTVTGSDPDAETLSYSATGLPSGASVNSLTGAFSWTPSYTQSGSYSVTFRTSDIGGLYAEEPISITVTNVNRTPTFSPVIGNRTVSEASLLSFSITGTDPDSDAITYTAGNLPVGAVMTASSGAFSWTPDYTQSGTYPNIAFTVTDTGGLYTTEAITITVNNTNRAPVLSPIGNQSTNENQLLTFTISGTDPDGGSVTYTGIALPSGASVVSSTGVFSWTPSYTQAGTYNTVRFRATDIAGLYGEELITIVVTNVNVAPVLASIGNKTVNEGSVLAFTVSASDVGGDTLTYSAITLPSGATLNSSNGIFRWTPTYDQAGTYASINFKATDPGALYDEEAITITVNNTNRAPNLNPTGSQNATENSLLTFTASGSDPDGDAITFTATNLPSGAVFTSTTKTFAWTPNYLQAGSYNVVVRVTDTLGATSQESVNIMVNNLNRPCTLNPIGAKNVNEGVLLSFVISGTDPDTDDTLSYYAYNLPTGAQLNVNSGLFTWTPTFVQAGTYNVTFRVIDPYGSYNDELVSITVNNVPAPPTITTEPASDIDVNMVTLNGTANPNEISSTAYFQWGISTTFGVTTTAQALGSGATILNVSQVITGLEHNSTYYYRMVAYNSVGTSYGITRTFTTITNTNWAMVAGGEFHTIGVKNDGSLWAWGDNSQGQLGLNDLISRTSPTRVGTENTWVEAACGSGFTVARKNNHTLWGSGDNSEGQLGLGPVITRTLVFLQVGTGTDWTRITAGGSSHCVAMKQNTTIWTWGTNNKGQLGLGDYNTRTVPEVVSGGSWKAVSCGFDHSMAIASNGSVYAWGDNSNAQLGTGDYVTKTTPTLITTTPFSDIAGGYGHTVAIKSNGDLFAWGRNQEGELGTGDYVTKTTPTLITTSGWSDIEVGYKHTVARKSDGSIWSWGDNSDGQLGTGDLVTRTNPTLITGTGITWDRISTGWRFTAGIDTNGDLAEWGDNQYGQLGNGNTTDTSAPVTEYQEDESGITDYGTTLAPSGIPFYLSFSVTDVAFDPIRPYIYITDKYGRRLYVVNLNTGYTEKYFSFAYMPESISIRPDGSRMYVASLTQEHSSYWWDEDQSGYIAEFILNSTLSQMGRVKEFLIEIDPGDIVATDARVVYVGGGSGQWINLSGYRTYDGQRITTVSGFRQWSRMRLHANQRKIHAVDVDSSSEEIERYNISITGMLTSVSGVIYPNFPQGTGENIFLSPLGNIVITEGGSICRTTDDSSDRTYIQGLSTTAVYRIDIIFDTAANRIYSIDQGQGSSPTNISCYNLSTYALIGTIPLNLFYPSYPYYIWTGAYGSTRPAAFIGERGSYLYVVKTTAPENLYYGRIERITKP